VRRTALIAGLIGVLCSPASGAEAIAKVAEVGLVFELTGDWSKQKKDDPELAVYRARDVPEQLTLHVFKSKKRMDSKARRETIEALVEHHQAAERRDMGGKVSFQPVRGSDRNGLTMASYCGADRTTGRPFATMILASESSAWTLFYETLEAPAPSFCSRGERLFGTVRLAK